MGEEGSGDTTEEESSKSSMIFIQLLLLAPPILTAPVIFTSGNIGEDYGIDLLILGVIGIEFAALAAYGIWKTSRLESETETDDKGVLEELTLLCPNCKREFPHLTRARGEVFGHIVRCTFCGEDASVEIND